jgi:ubiquitin C-terminal hydrolase
MLSLNISDSNNIIHIISNKKNKEKIKEDLSSIKEEKLSNSKEFNEKEDDDSFYLLNENKEVKKAQKIEKLILKDNKNRNRNVESDESIKLKNNEEDEYKIIDNKKEDSNKKNKKIIYPKEEKFKKSKVNSKSQLDLEFLNKEEQESVSEEDYKYYIQKAFDQEEEYKIIFEFNKLPYKPKELLIDLGVFDEEAILKCIIICYFNKEELRFILKLYLIYLSKENELYSKQDNEKIIMNYFLKEQKNEKNNEKEDNIDNNDKNDLDNIQLKVFFKRFRIAKGNYSQVASGTILLKKKNQLDGFQKIIFEEEEDLVNYFNYHKIFYILQIQNINKITSKIKDLPVKKIGIQNEGNTCYMNSIIQSIYNNQFLLKNIMEINTNSDIFSNEKKKKDKNVILSLQSIFYQLNKNKYSIKIIDIFYAFQWKRYFWNSPQDAEEIYMEIYEIISKYNEDIKKYCEGILENTIEVKEINHKSTKEENFFFLQLDIENNHSLKECLNNFFKNEELTGENKYQYIDSFGNKFFYNANKFYIFKKIPNILFIQLKRFQYDSKTLSFNKNNNQISFEEEIDLTNYINGSNYNSKNKRSKKIKEKEIYILYCILVHSGSAESGHYFCFIKDFKNNCYIKFNDTSVSLAEKKEVFNDIFGGEKIEYIIKNTNKKKDDAKYEVKDNIKEITKNAYILIYIKKIKLMNFLMIIKKKYKIFLKNIQKGKKKRI